MGLKTLGLHMMVAYFVFFTYISAFAREERRIEPINNPKSLEDFDHEFKGCPENSDCDKLMGEAMIKWLNLIKLIKTQNNGQAQKTQLLEDFRANYGIPTSFYTNENIKKLFTPILFSSSCREHKASANNPKTLKATALVRSFENNKIHLWKDNTLTDLAINELVQPKKIIVYYPKEKLEFFLDTDASPLYIKDKEIYLLKENDDFFYGLKINLQQKWKIVDIKFDNLSFYIEQKTDISCPNKSDTGCFKLWDETLKTTVLAQIPTYCTI